jgi:predicted O-methyltransferase YrrM
MDKAFEDVRAEYEARYDHEMGLLRAEGGHVPSRRDERLLAVGPEVAQFMVLLVESLGCTRLVELGTSYGYSTLWLAKAAKANGGKLTTIDVAPDKQAYARERIERAGLGDAVEFVAGDAVQVLARLAGPFDFALVDLWKDLYVPTFEQLYPKLATGAVIVADNMLIPELARPDANRYREAVRAKPDIDSILLPIGQGIELSRKL